MARRRTNKDLGLGLDALMDTLTNVIGILIIVLVLVQINMSQAVKKIVSDLPAVSAEELGKIKAQADAAAKQLATTQVAKDDAEMHRKGLAQANAEYAKIEGQRPTAVKLIDLDKLKKQLGEKRKVLEANKAEMAKRLAEQEKLKALLDTTPVPKVEPPKQSPVVRIPNSRPVPEKAKFARVLVAGGQLFPLDVEAAEALVMREFKAVRHTMVAERGKDAKGAATYVYDQEKVVKFFESRRLRLGALDIEVPYNKPWTRLPMKLKPRAGAGEPVAVAARLNSRFGSLLREAKRGNTVVWFHVARDSFEAYLQARQAADAAGVPAGWEVAWEPTYAITLNEIPVTRLADPPAPAPPSPSDTVEIKPPTKALD